MAYEDFKDFTRITASDTILHDKAFNIAKNPKYDGYQRGRTSIVWKCFDKELQVVPVPSHAKSAAKNENM